MESPRLHPLSTDSASISTAVADPAEAQAPYHDQEKQASNVPAANLTGGEGQSAIPEDKKEEALENAEDDWAHDPINPRNWTPSKKWTAVSIVRHPIPPLGCLHT